jgi:hypothetical protein
MSKGRIVSGTNRPSDGSSKGRIYKGTDRPYDATLTKRDASDIAKNFSPISEWLTNFSLCRILRYRTERLKIC